MASARLGCARGRGDADGEVTPDPGIAGGVPEREIDALSGGEARRVDLEQMQAERVGPGLLFARVLPAVEPPAEGARLAQREREAAALGQIGRRRMLAPEHALEHRTLPAVALPYGRGAIVGPLQPARQHQLDVLRVC